VPSQSYCDQQCSIPSAGRRAIGFGAGTGRSGYCTAPPIPNRCHCRNLTIVRFIVLLTQVLPLLALRGTCASDSLARPCQDDVYQRLATTERLYKVSAHPTQCPGQDSDICRHLIAGQLVAVIGSVRGLRETDACLGTWKQHQTPRQVYPRSTLRHATGAGP
jgi:hypothetical protein